jgi:hypothetical protein
MGNRRINRRRTNTRRSNARRTNRRTNARRTNRRTNARRTNRRSNTRRVNRRRSNTRRVDRRTNTRRTSARRVNRRRSNARRTNTKKTNSRRVNRRRSTGRTNTRRTNRRSKAKKPLPKSKSASSYQSLREDTEKYKGTDVSYYRGRLITDVPIDEDYHLGSQASIKHLYKKYKNGENLLRFFTKILKNLPKKIVYFAKAPIIKGWGSHFDNNHFIIDLDWNNIVITEDLPKELIKFLENNKGKKYTGSQGTWPMAHAAMYHTISSGLTKEINKGIKLKYRFICVRISLKRAKPKLSHSNIVVYDTKNKIVELFEPHGHSPYLTKTRDHYKEVASILKKYNKHMFPKYKFMEPKAYLPKGIQGKIDNFRGACVSICMMFLHYKLLNPDVPSTILAQRIKENGKLFLNRYMKYIENTIKNKNTKHKSKSIKTV